MGSELARNAKGQAATQRFLVRTSHAAEGTEHLARTEPVAFWSIDGWRLENSSFAVKEPAGLSSVFSSGSSSTGIDHGSEDCTT